MSTGVDERGMQAEPGPRHGSAECPLGDFVVLDVETTKTHTNTTNEKVLRRPFSSYKWLHPSGTGNIRNGDVQTVCQARQAGKTVTIGH